MVVDYELAYTRLMVYAASKPQHGREGLTREMIRLLDECRVSAGELSRILRLYGIEVERARLIAIEPDQAELGGFAGGSSSPGDAGLSEHHRTEVHDVSSNGNGRARG